MKRLRKVVSVALALLLIVTFSINTSTVSYAKTASEKAAIKKLNNAANKCKRCMNRVYGAWYYYVEYSSDDKSFAAIRDYASCSGISKSKVRNIIDKYWGDDVEETYDELYDEEEAADDWDSSTWGNYDDYIRDYARAFYVNVLSTNQDIVQYYNKSTYKQIKALMKSAKSKINKSRGTTKKNLKNYYYVVSDYLSYIKNPTGNFSKMSDKRDSFNSKLKKAKRKLS